MRVSNMIELIGQVAGSNISVNQERCVLIRNRNADCLRCAEACVSGCISYSDNELVVDPFSCIGCSTCCTVCPTAALEAKNPTDYDLILNCERSAAANGGEVVAVCERLMAKAQSHLDADKIAQVVCVGRMEESIYAALAADGVARVTLCESLCEGCEYHRGREVAQQVADTAHTVLDVWHDDLDIRFARKIPSFVRRGEKGYDSSRRAAFAAAKDDAAGAAKVVAKAQIDDRLGKEDAYGKHGPTYVHVNDQGILPHFVPDRRRRLIDALQRIGEPEDVMFDTRLWGNVIIDPDKCRSCYMCATFCPTGAMEKLFDENGTAHGVGHVPSLCVKCRTCENICLGHAITISEEVFAVDMTAGMTEIVEMADQEEAIETHFGGRYEGFGSR